MAPLQLTPRDIAIFQSESTYGFLTTDQLKRLHFPTTTPASVGNRMKKLATAGFHSRAFAYPKALDGETGRPTAVHYLTTANLKAIQRNLTHAHKLTLADELDDLETIDRHDTTTGISHNTLTHEYGITEFYLSLTQATEPTKNTILFWERTSPISKEVKESFDITIGTKSKERTSTTPFNPDALLLYKDPEGISFRFHEHDNSTTSNLDRLQRKFAGYLAYRHHNRFQKLLERYTAKYLLPLQPQHIQQLDFKVLFTAPDERRRNKLLHEACRLPDSHLFYFASMTDLSPETILTPIFLSAADYKPIYEEEKQLPINTKRAIKTNWRNKRIATLPRTTFYN